MIIPLYVSCYDKSPNENGLLDRILAQFAQCRFPESPEKRAKLAWVIENLNKDAYRLDVDLSGPTDFIDIDMWYAALEINITDYEAAIFYKLKFG